MRNTMLDTVCLIAVLALSTACTDTSSEPVLDSLREASLPLPAFSMIASNAGGAEVERFTNTQFVLIYDASTRLLSAHMPSNVCGDGELNVVNVQRIRTPSLVNRVSSTIKDDDSRAAVYQVDSPSDASLSGDLSFFGFGNVVNLAQFCAFLAGPHLIAEGTVHSISTFSAASFHLRRTGIIQGVDGQNYQLTENYQLNADAHDPNNPATFKEIMSSVSLTPVQ